MNIKLLAVVPVIAIAVLLLLPQFRPASRPGSTSPNGKVRISKTTSQAFGSLTSSFVSATNPQSRDATSEAAVATDRSKLTIMPVPPEGFGSVYRYVYAGEQFELNDATLEVLERRVPSGLAASSGLIQSFGLGAIDLSTFTSLNVQNVSLTESGGYTVNISGTDGSVNIYKQTGIELMKAEASSALGVSLPADSQMIAISDGFLRDHRIDTSAFGSPKVIIQTPNVGTGLTMPATDSGERVTYFGGQAQIIYPLLVNGILTYGLWGDVAGMNVTVDTTSNTVSSLYNLTTHDYAGSQYPAVTDTADVLKVAERGGIYGYAAPEGASVTDLKLETPERVYVSMYRYNDGNSRELLVPALRFPVQAAKEGMPNAIVVPLVKDMLAVDLPVIEPARGGASDGSSGSGTTITEPAPAVVPKP